MNYSPKLHNFNHLLKSILGRIEYSLKGINSVQGELLVLNYHGVQKKFLDNFREQIGFFNRHFEFVSLADLGKILSGDKKGNRPFLLLTFDDGIKNNLNVIEILQQYSIKAVFFIVPDFANTNPERQKDFFLKNIRPQINTEIDQNAEDFSALSWDELKQLISAGHSVGSHSLSHTMKKGSKDLNYLEKEIIQSKKELENHLGKPVNSFCSINNTLESVGEEELKLIHDNYDFHFTTLPGNNRNTSPYFIRRVNVESHWLKGAVLRACGKWDLKRWKGRETSFAAVLKAINS